MTGAIENVLAGKESGYYHGSISILYQPSISSFIYNMAFISNMAFNGVNFGCKVVVVYIRWSL
ncbi:hypothetical protein K492DRAFT_201281 [Lichtheimia hyalospora FSU 10163]|nr:hypothetical protein K492DRAFT_201281 [Lichtheimia hyalospora FSU 10163]